MRIEGRRTLILPVSAHEGWRALTSPARLPAIVPDIVGAMHGRDGTIRLIGRFGRRRRGWYARPEIVEAGKRLVLTSADPDLQFRLEATVEPKGEGCVIETLFVLEPPDSWRAGPRPPPNGVRLSFRLVAATFFFALSAAGVLGLPSLRLPPIAEGASWGLIGAFFLVAVSLLSGTHKGLRFPGARRRGLKKQQQTLKPGS